ncbi:hypothetical protein I4U23_023435 [Adineta vaga]|nr:hypothetical protein I4U23_023435 [Adineta vaga]
MECHSMKEKSSNPSCTTKYLNIQAQDPIGLKVSASFHGLLLGTATLVDYLRRDIDQGQYNATIPEYNWIGENLYNFTDSGWLLGATPTTTGWVQQNGMQLRGHTLVWAYDMRIPH